MCAVGGSREKERKRGKEKKSETVEEERGHVCRTGDGDGVEDGAGDGKANDNLADGPQLGQHVREHVGGRRSEREGRERQGRRRQGGK